MSHQIPTSRPAGVPAASIAVGDTVTIRNSGAKVVVTALHGGHTDDQFQGVRQPSGKIVTFNAEDVDSLVKKPKYRDTLTSAPELLNAAAGHMQDRASTYDKPEGERSMAATVAAFNIITGRTGDRALSESEGWLLLQTLKDVRDRQRAEPHRDSLEDGIAYSALKAEARLKESST